MSIRDIIDEHYPDALVMDGYDNCIIGICHRFGQPPLVAYDQKKIIDRHVSDGATYEQAIEFFEFNQIGAWVGERTPVFIQVMHDEHA